MPKIPHVPFALVLHCLDQGETYDAVFGPYKTEEEASKAAAAAGSNTAVMAHTIHPLNPTALLTPAV